MFKAVYNRYLLTISIVIIVSHFGYSFLLSNLCKYFYNDFIINVRNHESQSRIDDLTTAYLYENIRTAQKPVMLIMGTSFSYGYGLLAKNTYSKTMEKHFKDYFIMNASVTGEPGNAIYQEICSLKKNKIKIDTLIIELNLFNFTMPAKNITPPASIVLKKLSTLRSRFTKSYFSFYLLNPLGLHAIINLDLNKLYEIKPENNQHHFSFVKLPDDYAESNELFTKKLPQYRKFISNLLEESKKVASHVYFFIAPVYGGGIRMTQFKITDIEKQLSDLYHICLESSEVTCLNPGIQEVQPYFSNLSHYNDHGQYFFAQWLTHHIDASKTT